MNIKSMSIFLLVFLLAIAAVSAADENMTNDDNILAVSQDSEDLAVVCDDNVSLASTDEDCLSVSSDDNLTVASAGDDCLSVSADDNLSVSSEKELPVSVSVESELSAPNVESKLSMPVQEDSKLTSTNDNVYSSTKTKKVWLASVKYKYTWSKKKVEKVTKQKLSKNKIKKILKKYMKKGWNYDDLAYKVSYGKKTYKIKYYIKFYK